MRARVRHCRQPLRDMHMHRRLLAVFVGRRASVLCPGLPRRVCFRAVPQCAALHRMAWHRFGCERPAWRADGSQSAAVGDACNVRCRRPIKLELFPVSRRSSLWATATAAAACTCVCACVRVHGWFYLGTCVSLCACVCVRAVCASVCACMFVGMCASVCACMCACMCVCACGVHEVLIRVCFQLLLFSAVPVPAWLDRQ
jgi:hypothetical protein